MSENDDEPRPLDRDLERIAEDAAVRASRKILGGFTNHDLETKDGREELRADLRHLHATRMGVEEFRKMAETLDQVRESIVAAFESKTGMEHDELLDLPNAETWMTADEAVAFGFADEIEAEKKIAASAVGHGHVMLNGRVFDLSRFEHPPEAQAFIDPDDDSPHDTYANQATAVMDALAQYERRSLDRLAVRAKSGKSLTVVDTARWERIRDAASGVLAKVAAPEADKAQALEEGEKALAQYALLRARLIGVPV